MLWTKRAHQCTIFGLLCALMKVDPIPQAIFETTRSGFIQILHPCSVSWKINPLYIFLAQTSYSLDKNSPLKWNFWTFEWMGETLHHSSVSWEISPLYFCSWNYMIFTKGTHHSAKVQTFNCSGEISPNLYFDRLLLLKVYKVSAKKSMDKICLMITKSGAKFEWKLFFCFKNDKNLVNFDQNLDQNLHVDWSLLC